MRTGSEEQVKTTRMTERASGEEPRTVVSPNGKLEEPVVITKAKKSVIRRIFPWLLAAILGLGAFYGWGIIQFNKTHETTDDAQIDADINPVLSRLPAYVQSIAVGDNQSVKAGDVLVQLDAKDLVVKVQSAEAAYESAVAAVTAARSSSAASQTNIRTAEVAEQKAAADLTRDERLLTGNAITEQQMLSTRAAHETAAAQLATVRQQATAVQSQIAVAEAQVAQRKADLENVRLQLSYATITAPSDGIVAKKNVQVGEFVQAGQPLMAITPKDVWITANFKETQISEIRPGAQVSFEVDAYPGYEFHGSIGSISPATGAKFALLPPDNASGNYVKVVQRIPVRIHVDESSVRAHPLRPGMSVDVTVTTGK